MAARSCWRAAMFANVAEVVSAMRLASVASRRVFCRSFLQTCSSTATWEFTGRFCDSSTVGGFGGELHEASAKSQGTMGVRAMRVRMALLPGLGDIGAFDG